MNYAIYYKRYPQSWEPTEAWWALLCYAPSLEEVGIIERAMTDAHQTIKWEKVA